MADNASFMDGESNSSDWIEIHNRGTASVDLEGYSLTDDPDKIGKWRFPGERLDAGDYLIVFASGQVSDKYQDVSGQWHTNFRLDTDGEYLALADPSGRILSEYGSATGIYPRQLTDVSYGVVYGTDGVRIGYMDTPSPGDQNTGQMYSGFVESPTYSLERGYFDSEQTVEITTETVAAEIYFTIDGSVPWPDNPATVRYEGPIPIQHTTILRSAAYRNDFIRSKVATQSYLFPRDVLSQSDGMAAQRGFPRTWAGVKADYGINRRGLDQRGADQLISSLKSLPSLSVVFPVDSLFGFGGIYAFSEPRGPDQERRVSLEWIDPNGEDGFQVDAGIRIAGDASRSHALTKKHSFRLLFKATYGASRLDFPVFEQSDAVGQFDQLVLRAVTHDGWALHLGAQFARDEFLRSTQLAMGQPSSHGRFVHVYLNGLYWGLYNLVERPDAGFATSYFGVDKDNWDGFNSSLDATGVVNAYSDKQRVDRAVLNWQTLMEMIRHVPRARSEHARTAAFQKLLGNYADGSDDPNSPTLIDIDNYIDFLIANHYGGNTDWPDNNFYVGRENGPESSGFKFFVWDAEVTLRGLDANVINNFGGVQKPLLHLRMSEDFRMRFADRVQRHLFEGGALFVDPENPEWHPDKPGNNVPAARYAAITDSIEHAVIAESARWGSRFNPSVLRMAAEWAKTREQLLSSWFPLRSDVLLQQYRDANLYPAVDVPLLRQNGRHVPRGLSLTFLQEPEGSLFYTLDGTDPRLPGGGVLPHAQLFDGGIPLFDSAHVKYRVLSGGVWSALGEAQVFVSEPEIPLVPGDSNTDGAFDQKDIVLVLQAGKYATGGPATFQQGDWNGDGVFDRVDIIAALQTGKYLQWAAGRLSDQRLAQTIVKKSPANEFELVAAALHED